MKFAGKSENDALWTFSTAVKSANRAAQSGDCGSAAKPIFLDQKNLQTTTSGAYSGGNSGRTAPDYANVWPSYNRDACCGNRKGFVHLKRTQEQEKSIAANGGIVTGMRTSSQ
jgi:hypothetical protein